MKSEDLRLFIGISFPEDIQKQCSDLLKKLKNEVKTHSVKWVLPEQLHITLKFLGNTKLQLKEEVIKKLDIIKRKPFHIQIKGGGYFKDRHQHPKVLFLNIFSKELGQLACEIDDGLTVLGYDPESRGYSPHLTLARIKEKIPVKAMDYFFHLTQLVKMEWICSQFVLYQSILKKEGSEYLKIKEFILE